MQVGHVLESMPSEHGRPMYLDQIACDFPALRILGAHTGWPWVEELISVCYKWDNVWFGVDAWMPKYLKPEIIHFIGSRMGQDRGRLGHQRAALEGKPRPGRRPGSPATKRARSCCATTPGSCSRSEEVFHADAYGCAARRAPGHSPCSRRAGDGGRPAGARAAAARRVVAGDRRLAAELRGQEPPRQGGELALSGHGQGRRAVGGRAHRRHARGARARPRPRPRDGGGRARRPRDEGARVRDTPSRAHRQGERRAVPDG